MSTKPGPLELLVPTLGRLSAYAEALARGWSADNIRGAIAAVEELERIRQDPAVFVASLDDPKGLGEPIIQPNGEYRPRLPGFRRWLWDDEGFAGSLSLRWRPGGSDLPEHVLGHIGYGVVPWKQGRGYATQALALALPLARAQGLEWVELVVAPDNPASQRVITANGGVFVEAFREPATHGGAESWRYRIDLT